MIEGSRIGYSNSLNIPFEIVFTATGNDFQLTQVLTEDKEMVGRIPDAEIEALVSDTSEFFEVWSDPKDLPEEYIYELSQNNITIFE